MKSTSSALKYSTCAFMHITHTWAVLLMVVTLAIVLIPGAWAHACVTDPPARLADSGLYSNMCSSTYYELSSGNCNGGGGVGCRNPALSSDTSVCGGPFQDSTWNPKDLPFSSMKTYTSGSTITLSVYYRVVHTSSRTPGWVEARLCTQGSGLTQSCFDQHRLQAVGGSGFRHTVPNTQQPWTTATYTFQLPAGVTCSECVLQYIWQTSSWEGSSGEQFQNCADISITAGGGSGGSPPSPSPPVPTPPSPPPPGSSPGTCDPSSVCGTPGVKAAPCSCSSDCSQFVNCANGVGVLQDCSASLVFNPAGYCDWSYNYACPC